MQKIPTTIKIYYFSGTGNTKIVAQWLQTNFDAQTIPTQIIPIEEFVNQDPSQQIEIEEGQLIGIGYPVHAFNAPRNVFEFLKTRLPEIPAESQKVFTFRTAGDPLGKSGSTHKVRKILEKKGYWVWYEQNFILPANVFMKFPPGMDEDLFNLAHQMSQNMVTRMLSGEKNLQKNGLLLRTSTTLFSGMESFGIRRLGRFMRPTDACIQCGKCARMCPTHNITLKASGEPQFHKDCVLCMRCVYACPQHAIKFPLRKLFAIPDGYNSTALLTEFQTSTNYDTKELQFFSSTTKGYYKHYVKFFRNMLGEEFTQHLKSS